MRRLAADRAESRSLPTAPAFDGLAAIYDARFTNRPIARWLRRRVWIEVDRAFGPGARVLDLGCGTGEDAVHLAGRGVAVLGIDESPAMLAVAMEKHYAWLQSSAATRGDSTAALLPRPRPQAPAGSVDLAAMRIQQLGLASGPADSTAPFDGAVANFGALNCVPDLPAAAAALAGLIRPGGRLVAAVMAPWCLWEVAWFLARGDPRQAGRRFRGGATLAQVAGRPVAVHYPSPQRLEDAFRPWFRRRSRAPLALALPPSYAFDVIERRPRLMTLLFRLEAGLARFASLAAFADHYLIALERRVD